MIKTNLPAGFVPFSSLLGRLWFLSVFSLSFYSLTGQNLIPKETIFVNNYGLEEGLRQSMVSEVVQDANGLIWMVSGDGLHCFDGHEFKDFRVPFEGEANHSDNIMRIMMVSGPNELIITSTSSILKFNTLTAKFTSIYRKETSYPVLLKIRIEDQPVFCLRDRILCRIVDNVLVDFKITFNSNEQPPVNFIPEQSGYLASGDILLSNQEGFLRLKPCVKDENCSFTAKWQHMNKMQCMANDTAGNVIMILNGEINKYSENGELIKIYHTKLEGPLKLFIDSKNNFWVIQNENNRLFRFAKNELKEIVIKTPNGHVADTTAPKALSVFEDQNHDLWMGTDNYGVLFYAPEHLRFDLAKIGFTRCMAWFDHRLWAGTFNNGLWQLSPDLSNAQRISPDYFSNDNYFLDLFADKNEHLWIASRRGLDVIDKNGVLIYHLDFECSKAKFFLYSEDALALSHDDILDVYQLHGKPDIIKSIPFVSISTGLKVNNDQWLGNVIGLYQSDQESFPITKTIFDSSHLIAVGQIYDLIYYQDKIWTATGNGIKLFNLLGEKLPLPAYFEEIRNEVIYALVPDAEGRIWFTGNRGIGCIVEEKKQILYFDSGNNLQSREFNTNAVCLSPEGKIYFGGIRGINGFDPGLIQQQKSEPAVHLLSLSVADTLFSRGIPPNKIKLHLNRRAPNISGQVFSTDYSNSKRQLFSFYLEGYQQEWSKPSTDVYFNYRDLPPGNYRLLAKAADSWYNWGEPVELLSITLRPPFWRTYWFIFLIIVVIASCTAIIVKSLNSARYRQRIKILEQEGAIEKERMRISKDMHDEVGASLTRISILSELAKKQKNDPVKAEKIIGQISEIAGNVVDEMSEIIWAMNPKNDLLDRFAAYIREYASTYLEPQQIEIRFHFPTEIPSVAMSAELRRNLFLTMKEALHNIVKHAQATEVDITLQFENQILEIVLKDNGQGFDPDHISNKGNGLQNMPKRLTECHGSYHLISALGKGTEIRLICKMNP